MRKLFMFIIGAIFISTSILGVLAQNKIIPDEAIRLRVLANSNSEEDQEIKTLVKNSVQIQMYELLKDTTTIQEAREIIKENIKEFDKRVSEVLKENNYDMNYDISFGMHYFPKKEFKGMTYDEGEYESLLITIGEGLGDNWWCVLFPPLCLMESDEYTDVEYKLFTQEIIDKYIK